MIEMEKQFICIQCPNGCELTMDILDDQVCNIRGNECGAGAAFAKQEAVSPMRDFTALIRCGDQVIPVKASAPVPRQHMMELAEYVRHLKPDPPVFRTETIARNVLGLGIDLIALTDSSRQ